MTFRKFTHILQFCLCFILATSCKKNSGNVELNGIVGQTDKGENSQIIVAFIDGTEVGRDSVVFDEEKTFSDSKRLYQTWRILAEVNRDQWPKYNFYELRASPDALTTVEGPFKTISIRSYTKLDAQFSSDRIRLGNEEVAAQSRSTKSVSSGLSIGDRIILFLLSVACGLLAFAFLSHYIPEVLPHPKTSDTSIYISNGSAGLISLLFTTFLLTSNSAQSLISMITGGLMTAITTAFSIVFLMISVSLFWKKLRAYF